MCLNKKSQDALVVLISPLTDSHASISESVQVERRLGSMLSDSKHYGSER